MPVMAPASTGRAGGASSWPGEAAVVSSVRHDALTGALVEADPHDALAEVIRTGSNHHRGGARAGLRRAVVRLADVGDRGRGGGAAPAHPLPDVLLAGRRSVRGSVRGAEASPVAPAATCGAERDVQLRNLRRALRAH